MPTSANRHPSRDALLRDGLGQLKAQRGITLDSFALMLNDIVHATVPTKMGDQPAIRSFTTLDDASRVMSSWRKRVERWFTDPQDGGTEIPAWLEEPWVTALEELGDEETRIALARRHGFLGVRAPESTANHATGFSALGAISQNTGLVMRSFPELLEDGVLDENDANDAPAVIEDLDNAIAVLMGAKALIEEKVIKKARLRAVQ